MSSFMIRTDLALEARESAEEGAEELRGVCVEEDYHEESEVKVTKVVISSKNSAKLLGKPVGTYITLEAPAMTQPDDDYHKEISEELAKQLKEIIPGMDNELSVMVVGLGNRDVTADALGPNVVDNLTITRHMVKEFGKAAYGKNRMHMISGLIPGVMAKTGMEKLRLAARTSLYARSRLHSVCRPAYVTSSASLQSTTRLTRFRSSRTNIALIHQTKNN